MTSQFSDRDEFEKEADAFADQWLKDRDHLFNLARLKACRQDGIIAEKTT